MNIAELVGGVLYGAQDPVQAADRLVKLLRNTTFDEGAARSAGFEPVLVESLRRRISPNDDIEIACASGASWVLGRRSASEPVLWEPVASLPAGVTISGIGRTTAETMIGLAATARECIKLAAPYVDEEGLGFLSDAIAAATKRAVSVEIFEPSTWKGARSAMNALTSAVRATGDVSQLRSVRAEADAPFSHLKVMIVDSMYAYIGSANLTGAGLAGRNLELGVLVTGKQVGTIERVFDFYLTK